MNLLSRTEPNLVLVLIRTKEVYVCQASIEFSLRRRETNIQQDAGAAREEFNKSF